MPAEGVGSALLVVVVILFPTEYKQWRTEQMSNIKTTINIDDPVGGHQRSQWLIGLATKITNTKRLLTKTFKQNAWLWLADAKTSANHSQAFC